MLKMYEDFKRFDQTFSSEGRYNWYTRMNTQKTACMFDFAEYLSAGAGHDAQMMAHFCPSTMIFIPSVRGISHNVEEFSHDKEK